MVPPASGMGPPLGGRIQGITVSPVTSRPSGSRDRDTSLRPHGVQGPLRPCHLEGVLQGRARAALRGRRPQHPPAAPRSRPRALPRDRRPVDAMLDRFTTCSIASTLPSCPVISWTSFLSLTSVRPASAASTSTRRVRAVLAAVVALAPAPGGFTVAELTEKVHSMTGRPTTASDRPPTTSASSEQKILAAGAIAPLSRSTGGRAHDHRAQRPSRARSRPDPRRCPKPSSGPQAVHLDDRRPRLRIPPRRHADPLRPLGITTTDLRRGIDNYLSITCARL